MDFKKNCKVIHKFILYFRGELYDWKTETWAYDHLKANNWSAENLKKNLCPQWSGIRAHNKVMWFWSADTLFWQLSINHNMDVYHQVKHRLRAPTLAWKFDISHWLPCGADGWADVRSRDNQISQIS